MSIYAQNLPSGRCERWGGVFDPETNKCGMFRMYDEDLNPTEWLHRNQQRDQCMADMGATGCLEQVRAFNTVTTVSNMSDRCYNSTEKWTGCWKE